MDSYKPEPTAEQRMNLKDKFDCPKPDRTAWQPEGVHMASLAIWDFVRSHQDDLDSHGCTQALEGLITSASEELANDVRTAHAEVVLEVEVRNEVILDQRKAISKLNEELRTCKRSAIENKDRHQDRVDDLRGQIRALDRKVDSLKKAKHAYVVKSVNECSGWTEPSNFPPPSPPPPPPLIK